MKLVKQLCLFLGFLPAAWYSAYSGHGKIKCLAKEYSYESKFCSSSFNIIPESFNCKDAFISFVIFSAARS